MTYIPQGLYEVLTSKTLTKEQKIESIQLFSLPIVHLDGENAGWTEPGAIPQEDAELLVEAVKNDLVVDTASPTFSMMTCNRCGFVDNTFKPDLSNFDLHENPEAAIEFIKKHFQGLGWHTAWGNDLCPKCVEVLKEDASN